MDMEAPPKPIFPIFWVLFKRTISIATINDRRSSLLISIMTKRITEAQVTRW